jgi:hypothetical protein
MQKRRGLRTSERARVKKRGSPPPSLRRNDGHAHLKVQHYDCILSAALVASWEKKKRMVPFSSSRVDLWNCAIICSCLELQGWGPSIAVAGGKPVQSRRTIATTRKRMSVLYTVMIHRRTRPLNSRFYCLHLSFLNLDWNDPTVFLSLLATLSVQKLLGFFFFGGSKRCATCCTSSRMHFRASFRSSLWCRKCKRIRISKVHKSWSIER